VDVSATGTSVQDVVARLRSIDDELPRSDGAAVFNRMYLTVTEEVAAGLNGAHVFRDPVFMEQLDVTLAGLWLRRTTRRATQCPKHGRPCSSVDKTVRCCRSSSPSRE